MSPHSGTQESGASYSQTTGWCTDCTETWIENISLIFSWDVLEILLMFSKYCPEMILRGVLSLCDILITRSEKDEMESQIRATTYKWRIKKKYTKNISDNDYIMLY